MKTFVALSINCLLWTVVSAVIRVGANSGQASYSTSKFETAWRVTKDGKTVDEGKYSSNDPNDAAFGNMFHRFDTPFMKLFSKFSPVAESSATSDTDGSSLSSNTSTLPPRRNARDDLSKFFKPTNTSTVPQSSNRVANPISTRVQKRGTKPEPQAHLPDGVPMTSYIVDSPWLSAPPREKRYSRGDVEKFKLEILEKHNELRQAHGNTPPLTYKAGSKITQFSQSYAELLARKGQMTHSRRRGYGENLYMGSYLPPAAVDLWYNEIQYYNFATGRSRRVTGHLTQLLWDDSKELGIGIGYNRNQRMWYVVCNYSPPGNINGPREYAKHVRDRAE